MSSRYARGKFPVYYDQTKTVSKTLHQQIKLLKFGRMPGMLIIDKQGIIKFAYYSDSMADIPPTSDIINLLKTLQ